MIYLGDVPADNSPDFSHYTAVGEVYNFSAPSDGRGFDEQGCESCKEQEANGALYSGQVILTDALVEKIVRGEPQRNLTLQSLDREEVIPYLRSNLHWRIVDVSRSKYSFVLRRLVLTTPLGLWHEHSERGDAIRECVRCHCKSHQSPEARTTIRFRAL